MSDIERRESGLAPTKRALLRARSRRGRSARGDKEAIPILANGERAPLSFAQEGIWLHQQLAPDNLIYNLPADIRLRGPLRIQPLRLALSEVVARHEPLRTVVRQTSSGPAPVVQSPHPVPLVLTDLTDREDPEHAARQLAEAQRHTRFDLETGPLLRCHLLRFGDEEHRLLLTIHHICFDAWSHQAVLLRDLSECYEAFAEGRLPAHERPPISYTDYAAWERGAERVQALGPARRYWQAVLESPPVLRLPTDRVRSPGQDDHAGIVEFELPPRLVGQIHKLAEAESTTLFAITLAAYCSLLYRIGGQDDIVVGCPVASRSVAGAKWLIGDFVNTLPVRIKARDGDSFRQLLHRVTEVVTAGLENQQVPTQFIVQDALTERDVSGSPLFQTMFVYERLPVGARLAAGVTFEAEVASAPASLVDLALELTQTPDRVRARLTYRKALWERASVERMASCWLTLLGAAIADPERFVGALALLAEPERRQLLVDWNLTDVDCSWRGTLHGLFEAQAVRTPRAVAVVGEDDSLSFAELDARANQLARHLRELGVVSGDRVGLCLERTPDLVVSLLGVLKAGAAYVPLDPDYPPKRLAYMVKDAEPALVLTHDHLAEKLSGSHATKILRLDLDWPDISRHPRARPAHDTGSADLAYVIYTSGSTGRPKGVMTEHGAVCNRLLWMQSTFRLTSDDSVLQKTPVGFDVSVWEFFWPLQSGARLVLARPGGHKDPAYLVSAIRARHITHAHFVPSMLRRFLEEPGAKSCTSLRRVMCSGESLPVDLQKRFRQISTAELHNLYGPTEAAVDVTHWACTGGAEDATVPIGRPIANTRIYILDSRLQPLPIGAPGELYIGGVQVARGYWKRPELTAERFLADPFSTTPGARLFRTGDQARYLPDGSIEFLGRLDQQVKIRGNRIELGEIECVLAGHPAVREIAVAVQADAIGEQSLVAYAVPAEQASPSIADLRALAGETLPDYMLPSALVVLPSLPLTPSGKLDRRALPPPDGARPELDTGYVAPKNSLEERLAAIWSEVLGVTRVGVHDNFFELGGHSLMASLVVARVRAELAVTVPLPAVFESPTVAMLALKTAALQTSGANATARPIARADRSTTDGVPLTFAQQGFWFTERLDTDCTAIHNVARAQRLLGRLNVDALRWALSEIVQRHEILRTRYAEVSGQPMMRVSADWGGALEIVDLSGRESDQGEHAARRLVRTVSRRPFDLAHGPVFRATLARLGVEDHVLLLVTHHIATDHWSIGLMFTELAALYGACRNSEAPLLAALPIQYADYALWQQSRQSDEIYGEQLRYWQARLRGLSVAELTPDYRRSAVQRYRAETVVKDLSDRLVAGLVTLGGRSGATRFSVLLAALQLLMHRLTGTDDIAVGSPVAGRDRIETQGLIGCFLNTVVLRTDLSGDPSFRQLLGRARETVHGAYANSNLPYERLVRELRPARSLARTPWFQVLLNDYNLEEAVCELDGIATDLFPRPSTGANFDLTMYVRRRRGTTALILSYDADLFSRDRMEELLRQYTHLLTQVVDDPDGRIGGYSLLTREAGRLLPDPHDAIEKPCFGRVTHRIAQLAENTPDRVAVRYREVSWSYGQLVAQARSLSSVLRETGLEAGDVVAVYGQPCPEFIASVLGVLKSGAAVLMIDPGLPAGRQQQMLQEAGAEIVIAAGSDEQTAQSLAGARALLQVGGKDGKAVWLCPPPRHRAVAGPTSQRLPEDAAYIFFTSGTTGVPKGVVGSHEALSHFVLWQGRQFDIGPEDRVALVTRLSFDVVLREIFLPLVHGATLCLPPGPIDNPATLWPWLLEQGVTVLHAVPTRLSMWLSRRPSDVSLPSLRWLFSSGEALQDSLVGEWRSSLRGGVVNFYGPTETTMVRSWHRVAAEVASGQGVQPIGRALPQSQLLVLSERGGRCGVGELGEIVIRSPFRSLGYLREEDTRLRFLPNPFRNDSQDLLYHTGDLGRYRPDGSLEICGRIDDQLKIGGIRVEPAEIASLLADCAAVAQCHVGTVAGGSEQTRLAAWVVPKPECSPSAEDLRRRLATFLPASLIPSRYLFLDSLPLTANGKIDRQALPEPADTRPETGSAYQAPSNVEERALAEIWRELLEVDRVGVDDDFFALGGHSLLAIQVVSRIECRCGVILPVTAVFDAPTIAELARLMAASAPDTPVPNTG